MAWGIRVRRIADRPEIPQRGRAHLDLYEVEYFPPSNAPDSGWHKITRQPVFMIEEVTGTGDASALIHAADRKWNGEVGDWAAYDFSLYDPGPQSG